MLDSFQRLGFHVCMDWVSNSMVLGVLMLVDFVGGSDGLYLGRQLYCALTCTNRSRRSNCKFFYLSSCNLLTLHLLSVSSFGESSV